MHALFGAAKIQKSRDTNCHDCVFPISAFTLSAIPAFTLSAISAFTLSAISAFTLFAISAFTLFAILAFTLSVLSPPGYWARMRFSISST